MAGWIKIYRQMKEHWLWKSERRLKWWLDILFTVNHEDSKVLIKGQLIECKRGQSVRSLETWAKEWNVTKKTVKDFFELLRKDSMLVYESISISTRITVCNYDIYQDQVNGKETKGKRKVNGEETVTTPKQEGIKNEKNINVSFEFFWNLYDKKRGDKLKLESRWKSLTDQERQQIIDYIPKYKLAQPDKKFRKDPQTFFNNHSWNDEIIQSDKPKEKEEKLIPQFSYGSDT